MTTNLLTQLLACTQMRHRRRTEWSQVMLKTKRDLILIKMIDLCCAERMEGLQLSSLCMSREQYDASRFQTLRPSCTERGAYDNLINHSTL